MNTIYKPTKSPMSAEIIRLIADRAACRAMIRRNAYAGNTHQWSFWMSEAKLAKKLLTRATYSIHWYLYLSGKTNSRPRVDMPIADMLPEHRAALIGHYHRVMLEAKAAIKRQAI